MADAKALKDALAVLASMGVSYGDVMKTLKEMKGSGAIKSSGRGKAPSDDPFRLSVRDAINSLKVNGSRLIDAVAKEAKDSISLMVTLDPVWKINFVKTVKRPKKAKAEKTVPPEEFAEPTVV